MRVGLYARVSTYDQQSLPMQITALREYASRRAWTIVAEVEDVASGVSQRPAREALMAAARRRELDMIVVWQLDRWGRSIADLVLSLQELQQLGVGFVSLSEALDFTTPSGRAMAGMIAVFAAFERDMLRDRVRAGLAEARRKGKTLGRPASARAVAADVSELHASGHSGASIARELGISRSSVRRTLQHVASTS